MNKKLAKIKRASLEIQERGILTFSISVEYEDGLSQNVGGLCLDTYNKVKEKREGSAYGCEMIRRLLLTLGVNDFSEMKGKIIWVYGDGDSFSFRPTGIGQLKVDSSKAEPLIFSEVLKEFQIENTTKS